MPHPIKKELDIIIAQFYVGRLSYLQARHKISETVDEEIKNISKKTNYKEIVSIGEAKKNAFDRLKRKRIILKKLNKLLANRSMGKIT